MHHRGLALSILLILAFAGPYNAQVRSLNIPTLINKLSDEREFDTKFASTRLIKLGRRVIPPVVSSLKQRDGCNFKVNAAEVIRKIDPKQEIVKTTLLEVATYKCGHKLAGTLTDKHSFLLNINAARILVEEVDGGIPLVADFFRDKDDSLRSSAASAFLALAERMDSKQPEWATPRPLKPVIVSAMKVAVPILVKALDDEEEFVRCRTYAALWRMQRSVHKELAVEATRVLKGMADRCP
jgi:HEAT repeat protein